MIMTPNGFKGPFRTVERDQTRSATLNALTAAAIHVMALVSLSVWMHLFLPA